MVNQNYPNFSAAKKCKMTQRNRLILLPKMDVNRIWRAQKQFEIPKISNTAKFQELVTKFNHRHYHNAFLVNQREIIRVIRLMEELFSNRQISEAQFRIWFMRCPISRPLNIALSSLHFSSKHPAEPKQKVAAKNMHHFTAVHFHYLR